MGRLIRSSVAISAGVGEATDTDYTPVLNGYLEAIQYTTTINGDNHSYVYGEDRGTGG